MYNTYVRTHRMREHRCQDSICKDGVGTITDVEGNINSAKCVGILDNNLLPAVLKFENYQWIFQDDSAPGTPVRTDKIVER